MLMSPMFALQRLTYLATIGAASVIEVPHSLLAARHSLLEISPALLQLTCLPGCPPGFPAACLAARLTARPPGSLPAAARTTGALAAAQCSA